LIGRGIVDIALLFGSFEKPSMNKDEILMVDDEVHILSLAQRDSIKTLSHHIYI
jgi:hypothetical protein